MTRDPRGVNGRLEADAVRAALTGARVLHFYREEVRGGRTLRLRECPRCKRVQRRSACNVDRDTGRWIHLYWFGVNETALVEGYADER
jgi:hypothetical protein